ncbi:ubiquitin-conjugating enzyme E2 C-like [Gorilla gorilla gorilla]|uniref:ubiquitin-conjugating enzyme E2 C-like n=1 Tax=Gorilla gorilla gorilla TaxID=9595 RepID=UPI003008299F
MACQNLDPATTSVAAAYEGATPSRGAARYLVGKRLQQELVTFTMPTYEDLRYKLSLELPRGYPYNVPMVKFLTPCYHPNMDTQGNICLDILKDKWSALYDVRTILLSIHSLRGEPNIDSSLNRHAAKLWKPPTAFKKHLQETYLKQVTRQEP